MCLFLFVFAKHMLVNLSVFPVLKMFFFIVPLFFFFFFTFALTFRCLGVAEFLFYNQTINVLCLNCGKQIEDCRILKQ